MKPCPNCNYSNYDHGRVCRKCDGILLPGEEGGRSCSAGAALRPLRQAQGRLCGVSCSRQALDLRRYLESRRARERALRYLLVVRGRTPTDLSFSREEKVAEVRSRMRGLVPAPLRGQAHKAPRFAAGYLLPVPPKCGRTASIRSAKCAEAARPAASTSVCDNAFPVIPAA